MKTPRPSRIIQVSSGSVSVRIYRTPKKTVARTFDGFTVAYYFAGKRHRKQFADLDIARAYAEAQADKIANGRGASLGISDSTVAAWARAADLIASTGKPIELVAAEYAEIVGILGEVPPLVAARDYRRRHPVGLAPRTVRETVVEFLTAKKTADRDNDYLRLMTGRLERFADAFPCALGAIAAADLERWLAGLPGVARTRRNYWADVRALVRWAKRKRQLPADFDEVERIELPDSAPGKIQPYSPEEMRRILEYAERKAPRFLPYLPIRAFSGVRFEEIGRLGPQHFHSSGWLSMDADITKTHQRRLIPILPVLAAWLKRYPVRAGQLLPAKIGSMGPRLVELIQAAGVTTRRNGLRDSYASFRMATLRDAGKVAEETGHSVDVLRRSYREIRMQDGRLITPSEARRWFGILPKSVTNPSRIRAISKKPNK